MAKRRRPKPQFQPFFDQLDNPELHSFPEGIEVDGTPPPPQLSPFDQDVLKVCGNLGDRVWAKDFQALLRAHPEVLAQISVAVDGEIFPGRRDPEEFLTDLTSIWFRRGGFRHIFCGTVHKGNLKGLHYVGRYLQLQEQGLAGKLPHNRHQEEVIEGAVYTVGVLLSYKNRLLVDRRTGYALLTDAAELLIAATVAFKAQSHGYGVCTFPVKDADSDTSYSAVFVKEDQAIVTFYPDATPSHPGCR
jgi:Bacterial EndoU nuclease